MVSFREPSSSWRRVPALVLPASTPMFCCPEAGHLATYATQLFERLPVLAETATAAQVGHAEDGFRNACFLLQQRWFEIRRSSHRSHQDKQENHDGAPCVYGVYLAALARFLDYRNRLPPPPSPVLFDEVRHHYKELKRDRARQAEAAATHWHPMELDHVTLVTKEPD